MMEQAIVDSICLSRLNFGLFAQLKEDLPKGYMITHNDIDFLAMLNGSSRFTKRRTIECVLMELNRLIEKEGQDFFLVYCDPFELFIDAGWIDKKHTVLI